MKTTNNLERVLTTAMMPAREVRLKKMINHAKNHYDYIKKNMPAKKLLLDRITPLRRYYYYHKYPHIRVYRFLDDLYNFSSSIIHDVANQHESVASYLEMVEIDFSASWLLGVQKIAYKSRSFGLDLSSISVTLPVMTSKGFELIINDKNHLSVFARIIWAAEGSDLVTPHTRYIVTCKK